MDFSKMTQEERLELLDRAKDAYYNTDTEIISDAEYDELEQLCNLENKSYTGSKQGNYDIKHTFIMGSLSKAQVKEQKTGEINWHECVDKINVYLNKAKGAKYYETTMKLDGCSFSLEFINRNGKAKLNSAATRGNGEWGTDITHWIKPVIDNSPYWSKINEATTALCNNNSTDIFCIRGEVLVKQSDFSSKYESEYTNPRAFTAGMLGIKFSDATEEKLLQGGDLHFVCYDYRLVKNNTYKELSWMNPNDPTYSMLAPYLNHIGELPNKDYCQVHKFTGNITVEELQKIYYDYDRFRKEKSEYALDGIVFKPEASARRYNIDRPRPVDSIAIKFMPMINATEVIDYEWKVGKTGEYFPTAILAPIKMEDGKKINRAAAHNYGWIMNNNCGIGSKVRISLAGDIIPFIYEIIEHTTVDNNINLPEDGFVREDPKSKALHYMKEFSEDEEIKNKFLTSCETLNINTIGPAAAELLYDTMTDDYDELSNVIYLMQEDAYRKIYDRLGTSKSIQNIVTNLKQYAGHITLVDIIRSFNFKSCGKKASEVCAQLISGNPASTASLPAEAYQWTNNTNSREYYLVTDAMNMLDVDFIAEETTNEEKIPIIMTGSPEECGYATKGKFLQTHPEYVDTTSWKECKILFTNDLNSNTGKMQKAKKAGIEIKRYDDADGAKKQMTTQNLDFNDNKTANALF